MKKVYMYTLSTCPWCRKAKQFFTESGVAFEFTDYDLATDEDQARIVEEIKNSGRSAAFPYVVIDGEVVVGWNPERYKELLGI